MATNLQITKGSDSWEANVNDSGTLVAKIKDTYIDRDLKITVPAGQGSVTATAGSGNVSGSNCTLSSSDTSGVSVTGKGTVSATAKITTAGYLAATQTMATDSATSEGQTKYITGVTIGNSKSFTIEDPINTWTWVVDGQGNVYVE